MVRSILLAASLTATLIATSPASAQYWGPAGRRFYGGYYGNGLGISVGIGGPFRSFYYSSGYPYYGGFGGFGYGNGYPYGTYYNPGAGYLEYYLPPIYAPAELAYGPQAMQRFVGPAAVDPFGGVPGGLGALGGVAAAKPEVKAADARPSVGVSNLESRRRAMRFIEAGDSLFREQRYHEAQQRYKSAAEAAPDVAEAYIRQGHALTATGRYELAATAFKRGLAIGPEWAASPFLLDSIYADARLAKDSHIEKLVNALMEEPGDANLIFVLAMFLHYDGDTERAARFFQKAADIAGEDALHLRPFVGDLEPAGPAPREEAPRPAEPPGVEA